MTIAMTEIEATSPTRAREWFSAVREGLTNLTLAPYLGPSVSVAGGSPAGYDQLAEYLGKKVALPKRARGNPWASAQYIESQKLRATVTKFMGDAFSAPPTPSPLQRYLATLKLPLIVDTWYDGAMRAALSGRTDWAEVQGISRAGIGESRWYRAYGAEGNELTLDSLRSYPTLLYKPHGSVTPAKNFLISDADYVEVLTEIDIQSPIPDIVRERREKIGFVYLGCRFHDQMLRNYARQIAKRSMGPRFAIVDPRHGMSRNEQRLFEELDVKVLVCPWADAFQRLVEG
ncbi:MAG TPA: SIR2 family protein [Polyangiales bacterium]